jgi:predicted dehydrogenase
VSDAIRTGLRVGIVGCGLIGEKRAAALGDDRLVGAFDVDPGRTGALTDRFGGVPCATLDELVDLAPDVVVVATIHSALAATSVLVEKPAGISSAEIDATKEAAFAAHRLVKVGFNHRFHPGIARAIAEARSGAYGEIFSLRGRYGHGGRPGYESEWRASPDLSGGGEVVDQGMHLLDLSNWLLGDLPVRATMLRTQFWNAPVDDNAVILLGEPGGVGDASPFALLHVSWTEWKNTFSIEIACRTAKISVDGLGRSYGPETLRIYKMRPELGPPDLEEVTFADEDVSWVEEWRHFAEAVRSGADGALLGDLDSARYCWSVVESAQRS